MVEGAKNGRILDVQLTEDGGLVANAPLPRSKETKKIPTNTKSMLYFYFLCSITNGESVTTSPCEPHHTDFQQPNKKITYQETLAA